MIYPLKAFSEIRPGDDFFFVDHPILQVFRKVADRKYRKSLRLSGHESVGYLYTGTILELDSCPSETQVKVMV